MGRGTKLRKHIVRREGLGGRGNGGTAGGTIADYLYGISTIVIVRKVPAKFEGFSLGRLY